jgi:hypothetical protein
MERKIKTGTPNSGMTKENTRELTVDELDAVSGGTSKLLEAACKGKVLKTVEIHGTA